MKPKKKDELESELLNDLLADDKTVPLTSSSKATESVSLGEDTGNYKQPTLSSVPAPASATSSNDSDETIRLNESQILASKISKEAAASHASRSATKFENSVRTTVGGRFAMRSSGGGAASSSEAALVQSENLRVAQQKIFDLEEEIQRLRTENEKLAAAGDTFRRRSDELTAENDVKTRKLEEARERFESEKDIIETSNKLKERENEEMKMKIAEFETRLSANLQKIRVRERELENRLELVKMESVAVVRSKDETVLELKRQIDQLSMELENYRSKGHELNRQISTNQETMRRTVKALRLALSLLEGGSDESENLKKAK